MDSRKNMKPMLSVVIVNYNTAEMTSDCIESVNKSCASSIEIILVDNASTDGSKDIILKKFPNILWIDNEHNIGFGRACNIGMNAANGDYILLINSDVVMMDNILDKCILKLKEDANIGVLGCKQVNENGEYLKSIYSYDSDKDGLLQHNLFFRRFVKQTKEVKAVMGSFMLFPVSVYKKTKGFDPDFFMYAEEIEWCSRIRSQGYSICYFEEAIILHKHGASSNPFWALRQNLLSNSLLFLKREGLLGYFVFHFFFCFNFFSFLIFPYRLSSHEKVTYKNLYLAYFKNWITYLTIPFRYSKKYGSNFFPLKLEQ